MTTHKPERYKRLSQALRNNLLKRKEQQRSRFEIEEKNAALLQNLEELKEMEKDQSSLTKNIVD